MADPIWWRCLHCDTSGQTTPTKGDIGGTKSTALAHIADTNHGVTTSQRGPVPERMSQAVRIPERPAA